MAQRALLSVLAPSLCCLFAAAAMVLADEEAEELPRSEALTLVVDPGDITLPRQQHFSDPRRRRRRRKHVREEEKEETVGGGGREEEEEENVTPASDVLRTAPTNPPKIMVRGIFFFFWRKEFSHCVAFSFKKKNSSGFQMKPTTLILHNHIQEAAAALQGYTKRARAGGNIDDSIQVQEWGRRSDLPKRRQASLGKTKKTTAKPKERRKRTRLRFRPRAREKGSSSSAAPTATKATTGSTHLPSSPSPAPTTTPPSSSSSTEYVYTVLPLGAVPESSVGGGGGTFSSQSESPPHVVLPSPTSQASYLDIPDFFGRFAQLQSFESKRRNGVPSSSTVRSVVPTGHRRNEASSSSSSTSPATEATVRHSVEAPPPSSVATTSTQPMGSDNDGILVTHLGAAKEGEKDFKEEEEEEEDEKHPEFLEAEYDSSLELRSSPSSLHHHTRSPLQDLPRLTDIIWGDRAADGGGGLSFAEMLGGGGGTSTFPVSTTFHVGSGTTAVEASSSSPSSSSAVIEHAPDRKEEEKQNPPLSGSARVQLPRRKRRGKRLPRWCRRSRRGTWC